MKTASGSDLTGRQAVAGEAPACPAVVEACPDARDRAAQRWSPWRLLPLAVLAGVFAFAYWQGWISALNLETIADLHHRFHMMIEQHPAAAIGIYTLIYFLVGALCVPGGALLTAAGGLAFGTVPATVATVIGATAGATLLFRLARNACGDWLKRRESNWMHKLRIGFEKDAFNYLLFLRLVPAFPFWFVNIAAAVLGLPMRTFVAGTFIGIIPATVAYASAGAGLGGVIAVSRAKYEACLAAGHAASCKMAIPAHALFRKELALTLIILGVVSLVPVILKKWRRSDV